MRCYKRAFVAGGSYFFTVNLQNRKSTLLIEQIALLRSSFIKTQARHPFYIDAIVIMPEHLHILMTLPEGESNYSKRLSLIKASFSRQIAPYENIPKSRLRKRERGIWQRRYWEHLIRDSLDYDQHVDYIHYNPVKHGLVKSPKDWPYSSIHRYIRKGLLKSDWACSDDFKTTQFGE